MQKNNRNYGNLGYLQNVPERIWWKVVAGRQGYKLSILQESDLVFDRHDRRIRQLGD